MKSQEQLFAEKECFIELKIIYFWYKVFFNIMLCSTLLSTKSSLNLFFFQELVIAPGPFFARAVPLVQCTREIYDCNQILVEYPMQSGEAKIQRAALFVNVKACGYPPSVQCSKWVDQYGRINSTIPCHYSKTNTSMAITQVDARRSMRDLLLGTLVPIIALAVSGVALCTMHTKCIKARNKQRKKR